MRDLSPYIFSSDLITCGRYDKQVSLQEAADPSFRRQSRLWSMRPRSPQTAFFLPIASDGEVILHAGERQSARAFLSALPPEKRKRLLVLTRRELELLLPILVEFDATVTALESSFPVFSDVKYCGSLERQLQSLESNLRCLRKIGIHGPTLNHQIVQSSMYRIERAIRSKNGLDQFFALASPAPYQEVFKLKEERPGRAIVALDFNSMYASCMEGPFPEPKTLRYRKHYGEDPRSKNLDAGLYRVILSEPNSDFFCNLHPFRFTVLGDSFAFRLERNQAVEILLLENELLYYSKFFERIQLVESITSRTTVAHPLARKARVLYGDRLSARAAGREVKERALKIQIASLHSVTNQRRYIFEDFKSVSSLLAHASSKFQMSFPDAMLEQEKLERLGRFRVMSLKFKPQGIRARILNNAAAEVIHSFSSRVTANARLKVVALLERFQEFVGLEVCYVNADCVHVSVERTRLAAFLESISADLSESMGGLRMQCVAEKGYWFEPGRYWLFCDGKVVKFANKVFNHPGASNKFLRRRRVRGAFRGEFVNFTVDKFLAIERAFSYAKRLSEPGIDNRDYERYMYREVADLEVAGDSVELETVRSKGIKIDLFNQIATG